MLSLMRKHAASWFIKIVLGLIVVVFVFWGGSSTLKQKANRVAMVNGETISKATYKQNYDATEKRYQEEFGDELDSEMLEALNLRQMVLDRLINEKVLMQKAAELEMAVSDKELATSIARDQIFSVNGRFDSRRYHRMLQNNRMSENEFEEMVRDSILLNRLKRFIMSNVQVSTTEASQWYLFNGKEMSMDYAVFESSVYPDAKATEEDVQAYYDANMEDYETEPLMKVSYLFFSPDDFSKKVNISAEDIEIYYSENEDDFFEDESVEARHILIKTGMDDSSEKTDEARTRIEEIEKKARAGEDFAELARQFSECPSASRGGDLGTFTRGRMVESFDDAVFSMKAGEISAPVRTEFGWHIIKAEKINEERTLTLEQASPLIKQKLTQEEASDTAFGAASDAYDAMLIENDLGKAAIIVGAEVRTTDYFMADGPQGGIPSAEEFASDVFEMRKGGFSDILVYDEGYYVVWIQDKKPSVIPDLDQIREQVTKDAVNEIKNKMAKETAQKFLTAVKAGENMSDAASQFGVSVKTTEFFSRGGFIPEIGNEPGLASEVFLTNEANPYIEEPVASAKGFYVARFAGEKLPDPDKFEDEKARIIKQLRNAKRYRLFEEWQTRLKDAAQIKITDEYSNQAI